jgi:hypothetical protein
MQALPSCFHYSRDFSFVSWSIVLISVSQKGDSAGTNVWVLISCSSVKARRYSSTVKTEAWRSFEISADFSELYDITTQNILFFWEYSLQVRYLSLVWHVFQFMDLIKVHVKSRITVFWDVMPCSLVDIYQLFGGAYCPLLQGRGVSLLSDRLYRDLTMVCNTHNTGFLDFVHRPEFYN